MSSQEATKEALLAVIREHAEGGDVTVTGIEKLARAYALVVGNASPQEVIVL